jgi:elongation factor 1-beta
MAVAAIITKIMPNSPDENLENIKTKAKASMESLGAMNISFEEQDIAFGLKAVMMKMAWPEEKATEIIEENLSKIEGVSSAQIVDYRRAFG